MCVRVCFCVCMCARVIVSVCLREGVCVRVGVSERGSTIIPTHFANLLVCERDVWCVCV